MSITSPVFTHTPTHSHTLTCAPIQLISWTSEGAVTSTTKTGKGWKSQAFDEFIVLHYATFLSVCGRREMWVPCGAEGVRGSLTGLAIYVPLGPPWRTHIELLWWLGARLGVFQVFQEHLTASSATLLLVSTELSCNIWQRITALCWKETWNMSQDPTSSFVGFCILSFFFSHCDDCGPIEMAVILTRPFIWLVAPLLLSFIPSICHTGMAQMWLTAKFCRPLMWSVSGGVHKMQQGLCRLHVIEGKWSVAPEHLRGVS